MALISRTVGVTLPGAPSEGDPRGVRDATSRRALNLTPALGLVLRGRLIGGVRWLECYVLTDFGFFKDQFPEDQTKATPNSWFTAPDINL